jgi:hypothetical protein
MRIIGIGRHFLGSSVVARALALIVGLVLVVPAAAAAAGRIYWTAETANAIRVGNLDGSGAAQNLGANYAGQNDPEGIALDPALGTVYWANGSPGIWAGNLDGTGSPQALYDFEQGPYGVATDPATGMIYWASFFGKSIRVGELAGSASAENLGTNYADESGPEGVAIDPAAGKIYWADEGDGTIRVGNLDGSGTPQTLYTGETSPAGVAVDAATGKIYWTDFGTYGDSNGAIRVGNLDGSGTAQNLGAGYTSEDGPIGIAIDPTAGKVYWADQSSGTIRVGNLDGSGAPLTLYSGEGAPQYLALLVTPAAVSAPVTAGGPRLGSLLTCSQGQWAADVPGAFLYLAPRFFAYQWNVDGHPIAGANTNGYTAAVAGAYTCAVSAANAAGASAQTSATDVVGSARAKLTKSKISGKHRTAALTFTAIGDATGFQCALVKQPSRKHKKAPKPKYRACSSPKTYKKLAHGHYKFFVRALIDTTLGPSVAKSFTI